MSVLARRFLSTLRSTLGIYHFRPRTISQLNVAQTGRKTSPNCDISRTFSGGTDARRTSVSSTEVKRRSVPSNEVEAAEDGNDLVVWSCNEWDPLKEIIVGRAEGQRVPFLHPDLQAKTGPDGWKWIRENSGKPHDTAVVEAAVKESAEFCKVLELEGVTVRRPDPIPWDKLGSFQTPYFEDGGYMNACPRDGLITVEDEIIEAPMAWRSRVFEFYSYKTVLTDYFNRGARWTAAPRPTMRDEMFVKDFPYEDRAIREKMAYEGQFILTESEIALDAADCLRFGRDIFVSLSHATNRAGVEWLRRHLKPRGIQVHSLIFKGVQNCHADATFLPLRPGLLLVNPIRPCLKINDEPVGWEYFSKRGWDVVEVPEPVTIGNMVYVSKWVHMNMLSLDTERVVVQKGEEPMKKLLVSLGIKPIEVDMRNAYHLGGAFHCWTLDTKRIGKMESYLN